MTDLSKYKSLSLDTHSGEFLAIELIKDLVFPLIDNNISFQEDLCYKALDEYPEEIPFLNKIEAYKKSHAGIKKKTITNPADIFSKLSNRSENNIKNHALRFGYDMPASASSRSTWGFRPFSMTQSSNTESREYEDVINPQIIDASILDMCIVSSGDPVPNGFYRVSRSLGGSKANLNHSSGGNAIFLCIKKDMSRIKFASMAAKSESDLPPITNLIVIFPDRNEFVPPGYHVVQRGDVAFNLNTGTSAERVYLCFKRDLLGNPITDIQIFFPSKGEEAPKSFSVLDKSVSGIPANLNSGTSGIEILTCYKQHLSRLECLLNEDNLPFTSEILRATSSPHKSEDLRDNSSETSSAPSDRRQSVGRDRPRSRSPVPSRSRRSVAMRTKSSEELNGAIAIIGSAPANEFDELLSNHVHTPRDSPVKVPHEPTNEPSTPRDEAHLDETKSTKLDEFEDELYDEDQIYGITEIELVELRRTQLVVDSQGILIHRRVRKLIYAILSCVYVRHSFISDIAVQGLTKLLKDTDFFENDLKTLPLLNTVTMLDLTIESICDRFDLSSDNVHETLLSFLKLTIKHSSARLSSISLQRMYRAISFLCNNQATKSTWIELGLPMPGNDPGQNITPFKVLKQLIWDTVSQVEILDKVANYLPEYEMTESSFNYENCSQNYFDVRIIVEDFVDDVIDNVEISRICESAFITISKQSTATTSNTFWSLINGYARKLFHESALRSAYVTLCAICKQAWLGIRTTPKGDPIPRDLGTKLIALEAIYEFCLCAGEKLRLSKIMGYQIRRLVVPCLIFNVTYALVDHKIFHKLLRIITALWKKWRRHIRIEFAILCEQLIFPILQASVMQIRPIFQMYVIQEVTDWFDQPSMLIEMFVNYDMDRKFVSHWNTFSYLVRSMVAIGRRLALVTGAWDWRPAGTSLEEANKITITIRDVHSQALEEVSRIAKTLMDASGHAYLMIEDDEFRNRSLEGSGGWIEDENDDHLPRDRNTSADGDISLDGSNDSPSSTKPKLGSVKLRRAAHEESEELIQNAIKIYKEKSLKKAINYLISKDFMPNTPQEIANFLRVYKNNFDQDSIGDYLGEGGINESEEEFFSQIRFRYTRAVSFVEMNVEPALRLFLTGCGFRLPGEAQKIYRFVEVFVKAFWQDNSNTPYCPFKHPDTIITIAYQIIMLNTDLHRVTSARTKKNKKMSKEDLIRNLHGVDQGSDIDAAYLGAIYDAIEAHPIELTVKSNGKNDEEDIMNDFRNVLNDKAHHHKLAANDIIATVMLNNQKQHALLNTTNSILSSNKPITNELRVAEEKKFIREIVKSIRDNEDLLRSLAPYSFRFHLSNIDTKISMDLVSYMYETVWYHFYAIVEAILLPPRDPSAPSTSSSTASLARRSSIGSSLNPSGKTSTREPSASPANTINNDNIYIKFFALDILCYSLTSALFLNLRVERITFTILLNNFRQYIESLPHHNLYNNTNQILEKPEVSYFENNLENIDHLNRMDIITNLHHLMAYIKDSIQASLSYETTKSMANSIEKKAKILESNLFYVRSGFLTKVSSKNQKKKYMFFLFSDYLYYASSNKKEYSIHRQLPILSLVVSDIETDPTYCSFFVSHPIKSFVVYAESPAAKQQWIRDINQTIISCKKRENIILMKNESTLAHLNNTERGGESLNRRMSMIARIEDQQQTQNFEIESNLTFSSPDRSNARTRRASYRQPEKHDAEIHQIPPTIVQAIPFSDSPDKSETPLESGESTHDSQVLDQSFEGSSSNEITEPSTPATNAPSPEERAEKLQEAVTKFNDIVTNLDEKHLDTLFNAGVTFWKGMTTSRGSSNVLQEHLHLKLTSLVRQIKFGNYNESEHNNVFIPSPPNETISNNGNSLPLPPVPPMELSRDVSTGNLSSISPDQIQAWKELNGICSVDGKRQFLLTLFPSAPYWKYEQFI